jgi:hypothetical protein
MYVCCTTEYQSDHDGKHIPTTRRLSLTVEVENCWAARTNKVLFSSCLLKALEILLAFDRSNDQSQKSLSPLDSRLEYCVLQNLHLPSSSLLSHAKFGVSSSSIIIMSCMSARLHKETTLLPNHPASTFIARSRPTLSAQYFPPQPPPQST